MKTINQLKEITVETIQLAFDNWFLRDTYLCDTKNYNITIQWEDAFIHWYKIWWNEFSFELDLPLIRENENFLKAINNHENTIVTKWWNYK